MASIRPDKNRKTGQVRLGPNGQTLYRVRVFDAREQRQVEFLAEGLEEARRLAAEKETVKRHSAAPLRGTKVTVEEWALVWLRAYATMPDGSKRPYTTWAKAQNMLSIYLIPALGPTTLLRNVTDDKLQQVINGLTLADGTTPLAKSSKSTVSTVARAMFRDAVRAKVLPYSPATGLSISVGATKRTLIPSIPQVEALAEALELERAHLGDAARVFAYVGLRWQDLAGLKPERIDWDDQVLWVEETTSTVGHRLGNRTGAKTRAGLRSCVIPDQAMAALRRLEEYRSAGQSRKPRADRWQYLLAGERGAPLSYSHWRRKLALARAASGVPYSAHELRHVCAALLIASGASDQDVMQQMGHSSINTTRAIYGHLFKKNRTELRKLLTQTITGLAVEDDEEPADDAA